MFTRAKPDSLSVVMVVCKYPLTSYKVLFARLLSADMTGMVQANELQKGSVLPLMQVEVSQAWLLLISIFVTTCHIQCQGDADLEDLTCTSLKSLQCLHFLVSRLCMVQGQVTEQQSSE